ncbi:hypothetical protein [Mycoplasma suis]|uniref:Uncharacterized protein n=1 Tax=Mycoplasma suis (strain KI_3806) TaxID=708248 RepID=F0V1V7_MYCS3|nr:hypothetical protein [Mycoplasma suis]CBZ40638.1 hypothetical protein MSUIS_05450 [Mycoplasma suis KI3806]
MTFLSKILTGMLVMGSSGALVAIGGYVAKDNIFSNQEQKKTQIPEVKEMDQSFYDTLYSLGI